MRAGGAAGGRGRSAVPQPVRVSRRLLRCARLPVSTLSPIQSQAGLPAAAADRLYRSLYVYSIGFCDSLREVLGPSPHRDELLQGAWGAYMALSEAALQVRAVHAVHALPHAVPHAVNLCMLCMLCRMQ